MKHEGLVYLLFLRCGDDRSVLWRQANDRLSSRDRHSSDSCSAYSQIGRRADWLDEGRAESEERVAELGRELPSRLFPSRQVSDESMAQTTQTGPWLCRTLIRRPNRLLEPLSIQTRKTKIDTVV